MNGMELREWNGVGNRVRSGWLQVVGGEKAEEEKGSDAFNLRLGQAGLPEEGQHRVGRVRAQRSQDGGE